MELITGLILLGILIVPPLFLVGRRVLNRLFFDEANVLFGKRGKFKDAHDRYNDEQWENSPVYDGMITVEIPVVDGQVIAYEPLPDTAFGGDDENVVAGPVSRASRA